MDDIFEIKYIHNCIVMEKGKIKICVEKRSDGDIWFHTNSNIKLPINFYSRNEKELRSYNIFVNLMKAIIGRYILSDDYKEEYNCLPKDFINLEEKIITWHSDTDQSNSLQLCFEENVLIISMIRENNRVDRVLNNDTNNEIKVRIRTNGSNYGNYSQEFERLFSELSRFAYQVDSDKVEDIISQSTKQKK